MEPVFEHGLLVNNMAHSKRNPDGGELSGARDTDDMTMAQVRGFPLELKLLYLNAHSNAATKCSPSPSPHTLH